MQPPVPTRPDDLDEGFQRWWLGGAPGADDGPADPPFESTPATVVVAPEPPPQRRLLDAPPPLRARAEPWVAVAGSVAALALLWGFYGVVEGAVERGAHLATGATGITASAGSSAAHMSATAAGGAQAERVHAVYDLTANGMPAVHYTRWP